MPIYNFKTIQPVPTNKDLIDIVLTRTVRKTPTVVHAGWQISRIRSFYMRKVKFTQQTFHEKFSLIVDEFPVLEVGNKSSQNDFSFFAPLGFPWNPCRTLSRVFSSHTRLPFTSFFL